MSLCLASSPQSRSTLNVRRLAFGNQPDVDFLRTANPPLSLCPPFPPCPPCDVPSPARLSLGLGTWRFAIIPTFQYIPAAMPRICVYSGSSFGASPEYAAAAAYFAAACTRRGLGLVYGGGSAGLMACSKRLSRYLPGFNSACTSSRSGCSMSAGSTTLFSSFWITCVMSSFSRPRIARCSPSSESPNHCSIAWPRSSTCLFRSLYKGSLQH
jgi:hypothetical protein